MLPDDPDLKREPARWRDVAYAKARDAGVRPDRFEPYVDGSALVARVAEDAVVKLVQPAWADEAAAERWALTHLDGRALPVVTPRLLAHGTDESGWTWLVMGHVPGRTLSSVWAGLDGPTRQRLLHQIGAAMAEVHALPPPPAPDHAPAWPAFLVRQRAQLLDRQARTGLPPHLLAEAAPWVDAALAAMAPAGPDVLLTGEYTPFNLHADKVDGRWTLVGMVDMGDAFAGDARYDLIGPGVFSAAGRPDDVQALLDGYGVAPSAALGRTLLALHLLHRFSDLSGQVALSTWREARDLDHLAAMLWPC